MDLHAGADIPDPVLFTAHPQLSDEVNHNIIQSEIDGGVHLGDLPRGTTLSIETKNRCYRLVNLGDEGELISGHPEFCPEPVLVRVQGSTWGGSMLKARFVGRGMHLEFVHPVHQRIVTTPIVDVWVSNV